MGVPTASLATSFPRPGWGSPASLRLGSCPQAGGLGGAPGRSGGGWAGVKGSSLGL